MQDAERTLRRWPTGEAACGLDDQNPDSEFANTKKALEGMREEQEKSAKFGNLSQLAAARIQEARAQLGVADSQFWPQVDGIGGVSGTRISESGSTGRAMAKRIATPNRT